MKANVPREYDTLSPKQKERLKQYCIEVATKAAQKQEEEDCKVILDLYMKMVCCVLHDAFGFGEKRLKYFLGNHRRLFDRQSRLVSKGQQEEYLNKRMAEIFPKDGYPQAFITELIGEIRLIDASQEE